MKILCFSVYIIHIVIHIMYKSFSHIKFFTFVVILTGLALASVHHHDGIIHSSEIIVEIGDPECSMCDGTVKIDNVHISITSPDLSPISVVSEGVVMTANLSFERILQDRAPPSCA